MGDLQCSPSELKFRFELRKNIAVTLSLHNPGKEAIAFKVKTTNPRRYCVRPSAGVVEAGATKEIQVVMQAQREKLASLSDCKDKFLVQSCIVPAGTPEASAELFDSRAPTDIKHTKLRVVLLGPPEPPSPVPEGVEEDGSPRGKEHIDAHHSGVSQPTHGGDTGIGAGGTGDLPALQRENKRLAELLKQAERDRSNIKGKLDLLEVSNTSGQGKGGHQLSQAPGGLQLVPLIAVALIAFVIGWYL